MLRDILRRIFHSLGYSLKPVPKKRLLGILSSKSTVKIGKFILETNDNHSIKFNIKQYPLYNQNLPRVIKFLNDNNQGGSVIDIGANIGDTIAFIKNEVEVPIICFEGNDHYFELLQKNSAQFEEIVLYKNYLGEKNSNVNVAISFNEGTSALMEGNHTITIFSLDEFIADKSSVFEKVRVIKVDTDGYDTKILKGGLKFIAEKKPVIFFEYDPVFLTKQNEHGIDTLKQLALIGYSKILFYDNYGRFIISLDLNQMDAITQLHNYIKDYKAPFEFYDICIFHQNDEVLAQKFAMQETLLMSNN